MFSCRLRPKKWVFILAWALTIVLNVSIVQGQNRSELVFSTGDSVPGFGTIKLPRVFGFNDSGQIAFSTSLSGVSSSIDEAIYVYNLGIGLTQVAREGQANPSNLGGNYGSFRGHGLNETGVVLFESYNLPGFTTVNNGGLYHYDGSNATEIVRKGDLVEGGGNLGQIRGALNERGQVVFTSATSMTGSNTNNGLFLPGSPPISLLREGDSAPGSAGGQIEDVLLFGYADTSAFFYSKNMTGTSADTNEGIFVHDGVNIQEIVRLGMSAPGGGVFTRSGSFSFSSFHSSDSGNVVFVSRLEQVPVGTGRGVYRYQNNQLDVIARQGQQLEDVTLGFNLGARDINDAGVVVFESDFYGASGYSEGIFVSDGTEFFSVVKSGDVVNGETLGPFIYPNTTNGIQINEHGQVVYSAPTESSTIADPDYRVITWTPELHFREATAQSNQWDDSNNWTLGLTPGFVHDVTFSPDSSLTLLGPADDATVRSLQIGGANGIATVQLNGGNLTVSEGTTIESSGALTGDGQITGSVLNRGTLIANNVFIDGQLTNENLILGNASAHHRISTTGTLFNRNGGEIRVNQAALHLADGSLANLGRVEVIEGSLEVTGSTINGSSTGLITGRNATLRFNGGLNNLGSLGLSFGVSDVFGDVANTGTINISGGSEVTFYDDLDQEGVLQVTSAGSRISSAVFFGEFSGSGGFVGGGDVFALGDLRPGSSPGSVLYDGNFFLGANTSTFIELGGLQVGEFDQMLVTGNLELAGDLVVTEIDGFQLGTNMEFLIARVDGNLLGQFSGLAEGDLVGDFHGTDLWISYLGGDGNDIVLFTSIPEPGTGLIGLIGGLFLATCRLGRRK